MTVTMPAPTVRIPHPILVVYRVENAACPRCDGDLFVRPADKAFACPRCNNTAVRVAGKGGAR